MNDPLGIVQYHRYDAVCILITLPESISGVYQFACVDACIPIQYKCIDTNELYFYQILYYRDFTSCYISYRIACYYVYMIICMSFMCAHFMYADFIMLFFTYGCLVTDDLIKKFRQ